MRRKTLAVAITAMAVAVVVLGAWPLSADAAAAPKIVVGQSIYGVELGQSKAEVKALLGAPFRTEPEFSVFEQPCNCEVFFKRGKATSIESGSKTGKTDKGIGTGSSYAATVKAYPEAKCYHPPVFGKTSRYCDIRSEYEGRKVTTRFAFFDKALGVRDIELRLK